MCVSTVYSVLSRILWTKYYRHVTRVGFEPTTLPILEQIPTRLPRFFFHRSRRESITHIGVWVKTKTNTLYPRCKFNISYNVYSVFFMRNLFLVRRIFVCLFRFEQLCPKFCLEKMILQRNEWPATLWDAIRSRLKFNTTQTIEITHHCSSFDRLFRCYANSSCGVRLLGFRSLFIVLFMFICLVIGAYDFFLLIVCLYLCVFSVYH